MANNNLITLTEPRSEAAEAFRTLRTNLMFSSVENPLTTILVTSASNEDGKSQALANLAVTFAQAGNKTILVDADLRRPVQHEIWGISNERGLTTMMLEDTAMSTPPLVDTDVENLSILPSGTLPPVPTDVLSNQRMNDVIGVLKARANYIVFDSPPVLAASDAALLGNKVDGVLMIVQSGHTRRDNVEKAKLALEQINVNILGVALTNAPRNATRKY